MPGTPLPRRLARLWPVLALVVAAGILVATGAFERRTDLVLSVAPGVEVDCRNLVFVFRGATAQRVTDFAGNQTWEVVTSGTVRNPNDEALAPLTGDYGNFALRDPRSRLVVNPEYVTVGDSLARLYVPPGDTTMAVGVTFELPDTFEPGDTIDLGLVPMEYTDNAILGLGGDPVWNVDSNAPASVVALPLTRLPDREG